jgi:hypothetical protein
MSEPIAAKAERLVAMTARLTQALEADIAALESGRARELKSLDPAIQQLSLVYGREAAALTLQAAQALPGELRSALTEGAKRLSGLLARHQRLLTRMRGVSEGMIRAVADELDRRRLSARPYSAKPAGKPRSSGAMLYNSVA